jgi:ribosome biogenesis GTPase
MSLDSNQINSYYGHPSNTGTVFKKTVGTYFVHSASIPPASMPQANGSRSADNLQSTAMPPDEQTVVCAISNKLRKELIFPIADPTSFRRRVMAVEEIGMVDPVAVGDVVRYAVAEDGSGLITEVLPRRSKLARLAAGGKPLEQVIVANVDQVVIVFAAAQPEPKWNLLDRYLVSAEASHLPPVICVTKLDLVRDGEELMHEVQTYRQIGYRVITTSTVSGEGIQEVKDVLTDRVSVLVGKSGVGKTSLLNAIETGLGLRVNEISRSTGKGKHTTTHLEMFPLQGGGSVVDTPGIREFGLWEVSKNDIALLFPEMRPLVGTCQFGLDCSHAHEPGCAIKRAVADGIISERRYESMLKMERG